MDSAKAKELVSSFLTGGGKTKSQVTRKELEEACVTLNEDPDYVAYLEEEFGVPAPYLCATFEDRAAEYSVMTQDMRRRELPEVEAHLEVCTGCLDIYREVFLSAFASGIKRVQGELKVLGEAIRLRLSWTGNISEFGIGPAALVPLPTIAKALGPEGASKEWDLLLDESRDLSLHLDITPGRLPKTVEVRLNLIGTGAKAESEMKLAYRRVDGTGGGSGTPLSNYRQNALILDCESWVLRLTSAHGTSWDIPLVLEIERQS